MTRKNSIGERERESQRKSDGETDIDEETERQ